MQPNEVKRQFLASLRAYYRHPALSVRGWRGGVDLPGLILERLHALADQLWGCRARVPTWVCRDLGLDRRSTYHDAALRLCLNRLDELNDTEFMKALCAFFLSEYHARHPEAPEGPISLNVFVVWLRAYFPDNAPELIARLLSALPTDES